MPGLSTPAALVEAEYIHVADPETPWTKLELLMLSPPAPHQAWFPLQTSFIYKEALSPCEVSAETQLAPPCSKPQRYPSTSDSLQILPVCVYSLCLGPVSPPCAPYQLPSLSFPQALPLLRGPLPPPEDRPCCSGLCPLCASPDICNEDFFWEGFLEEVAAKPRTQTDLSQAFISAAAYTQKQDGVRWLGVKEQNQICREAARPDLPGPRKTL